MTIEDVTLLALSTGMQFYNQRGENSGFPIMARWRCRQGPSPSPAPESVDDPGGCRTRTHDPMAKRDQHVTGPKLLDVVRYPALSSTPRRSSRPRRLLGDRRSAGRARSHGPACYWDVEARVAVGVGTGRSTGSPPVQAAVAARPGLRCISRRWARPCGEGPSQLAMGADGAPPPEHRRRWTTGEAGRVLLRVDVVGPHHEGVLTGDRVVVLAHPDRGESETAIERLRRLVVGRHLE